MAEGDTSPEVPEVDSADLFRVFYDGEVPDIEAKVGDVSPRPAGEEEDPDGL
jgi:hypothetical protein